MLMLLSARLGASMKKIFNRTCIFLASLVLAFSTGASAQEKTGVREGFSLDPGTATIILMRPTIRVGAQSTGGMFEANADWTTQARENLERELAEVQNDLGNKVVRYDEGLTGIDPLVTQYARLFGAVSEAVLEYQFSPGIGFPRKSATKRFSGAWGLD